MYVFVLVCLWLPVIVSIHYCLDVCACVCVCVGVSECVCACMRACMYTHVFACAHVWACPTAGCLQHGYYQYEYTEVGCANQFSQHAIRTAWQSRWGMNMEQVSYALMWRLRLLCMSTHTHTWQKQYSTFIKTFLRHCFILMGALSFCVHVLYTVCVFLLFAICNYMQKYVSSHNAFVLYLLLMYYVCLYPVPHFDTGD